MASVPQLSAAVITIFLSTNHLIAVMPGPGSVRRVSLVVDHPQTPPSGVEEDGVAFANLDALHCKCAFDVCDRDYVGWIRPCLMSETASRTLAGVMRFAAPRWSSGPHSDGHHWGPMGVWATTFGTRARTMKGKRTMHQQTKRDLIMGPPVCAYLIALIAREIISAQVTQ
jgi:hypothetical protein